MRIGGRSIRPVCSPRARPNLYAGYAPGVVRACSNTNTTLAGDAAVNMGGGITSTIWALYQVDAMFWHRVPRGCVRTGRAVNPSLYRGWDAQAGLFGFARFALLFSYFRGVEEWR